VAFLAQLCYYVITSREKTMAGKSQQRKTEKNIDCFIIMPISTQKGYEEGHFTLVYEDIVKPSVEAANMSPYRADETKNTNLIQLDILRRVIETPIAVCDMSSKNPNVFYELGMRQAFDMPTVLIKDNITEAPFDISGLRYVTYNKEMKHRDVLKVVSELTETIIETFKKKDDRSEVSSLIRLMELSNPAKLDKIDLSEEARYKKLNEIHLNEILDNLDKLNNSQAIIMERLNSIDNEKNINKLGQNIPYDSTIVIDNDKRQKDAFEALGQMIEKATKGY
jgi:hypothetical protein